jgi:hypothetical protein
MRMDRVFAVILAMAGVSACSSEPEPEVAATPPAADAAPQAAGVKEAPKSNSTFKMARAVGGGKPGAAVELKYEIASKPQVGVPTEIEIALIPNPGVEAMDATVSGMDGITLAGPLVASFPKVSGGEAYKHTFSLLADREGVFYVTVSVMTQLGGAKMGRTFSIPFVVGNASLNQKPAAEPQKDASGQPIQPMRAEETTG